MTPLPEVDENKIETFVYQHKALAYFAGFKKYFAGMLVTAVGGLILFIFTHATLPAEEIKLSIQQKDIEIIKANSINDRIEKVRNEIRITNIEKRLDEQKELINEGFKAINDRLDASHRDMKEIKQNTGNRGYDINKVKDRLDCIVNK